MSDSEATNQRDLSNGWEAVAPAVIDHLGESTIGINRIAEWAKAFPPGAAILDLGCGPGTPRSKVLIDAQFAVYAVDAAPTMASAYQRRFPAARVVCEPVEASCFFGQMFDGVLAWGLISITGCHSTNSHSSRWKSSPCRRSFPLHGSVPSMHVGRRFNGPAIVFAWAQRLHFDPRGSWLQIDSGVY